jgi:hypothetical protein
MKKLDEEIHAPLPEECLTVGVNGPPRRLQPRRERSG